LQDSSGILCPVLDSLHKTDTGRWEQVQRRAAEVVGRLEHRMNKGWLRELELFSPEKARQGRIFYADTA